MKTSACLSDDRCYRYSLHRVWDDSLPRAVFIGLNPSTADETEDDPTIRRCIGFAKAWGMGGLTMLNLFAFRATDPRELRRAFDPIGRDNDAAIREHVSAAGIVVAAWGAHGRYMARDAAVSQIVGARLDCLGTTKDGCPRHPLYLRGDLMPRPFAFAEAA